MRALVLVAALSGCGGGGVPALDGATAAECFPSSAPTCMLEVAFLPTPWTCTTGAPDPASGRPDHAPCVLCWPPSPQWCDAGAGACVSDCAECTPAEYLKLDPTARCRADAPPIWWPRDMAL